MDETLIAWPLFQKVLLRFFFLLFSLFILTHPNGLLYPADSFYEFFIRPFAYVASWIGRQFFELHTINFDGIGSGDSTGDYLVLIVTGVLSLAGTVIWSVIDQKRRNYDRLFYWLIVILRCYLIATMTVYGFAKIFKTQFPYPSSARLNQTFGQSSPMGLSWTFFGYSSTYNYFMGVAELGCVPLLFFRRTTLLGGLLALVVTANIMAINYCFDVPVKILSTALVAMSIVIIAAQAKRLLYFFFLNRTILPQSSTSPLFKNKWINRSLGLSKYLLLAVFLTANVLTSMYLVNLQRDDRPDPLLGYYNVTANSTKLKWDEVIISADAINVRSPGQQELSFSYHRDVENHKFILFSDTNSKPIGELSYQYTEPDKLLLQGQLDKNKVSLKLELNDWQKTLLIRPPCSISAGKYYL